MIERMIRAARAIRACCALCAGLGLLVMTRGFVAADPVLSLVGVGLFAPWAVIMALDQS